MIDDSDLALQAAKLVLERAGFDVQTANTLGQFNVILTTWAPDLVLTDVNMPGVSGPEICTWIKARIQTHTVPILLYSGLPDEELAQLAQTAGAEGFLSKSRGLKHLAEQLTTFCEGMVW
ncbi:MAG: hypothetical protein NVS3B20_18590 [Polyangiales bacterium]